jgi:hypothetical protein
MARMDTSAAGIGFMSVGNSCGAERSSQRTGRLCYVQEKVPSRREGLATFGGVSGLLSNQVAQIHLTIDNVKQILSINANYARVDLPCPNANNPSVENPL